jgi:hypothetical protein
MPPPNSSTTSSTVTPPPPPANTPATAGFDTQRLVYVAGHADQMLHGAYFQPVVPQEELRQVVAGRTLLDRVRDDLLKITPTIELPGVLDPYLLARMRNVKPPIGDTKKAAASRQKGPKDDQSLEWVTENTLGTLFYDRLRFRYAGSMAKERIFSLSLGPGEESTITEQSETKIARSFESVVMTEQEIASTLSSRWSTEITAMSAHQAASSVGGNLGANVGAKLDFLQLGTSGALNFQSSNQSSGQLQTRYAYDLSSEITRKSREQHTTTIKVSSEQTFGVSNRRSIINRNPSRSLTLHFHKVYNKYQVSLERYDAKMALCFDLKHPYSRILDRIDAALDAIDPGNPANYLCTPPSPGRAQTYTIEVAWPDPDDLISYGPGYWALASKVFEARAGEVFSHYDEPKVTRFNFKVRRAGTLRSESTSRTDQFFEMGGKLLPSTTGPLPLTPGNQTFSLQAWNAKSLGGPLTPIEGVWWTRSIEVEVTAHFVPDPASTQTYRDCNQRERERLRRELTPERIAAVVRASTGDLDSHVLMELINQHFLSRMPNADQGYLVREFRNLFEWNEAIIDQLPAWMTGALREQHERVAKRIERMLPGLDAEDILPVRLACAGVQIVLPIRPGAERSVFNLMTLGQWDGGSIVQSFEAMRDAQFGKAGTAASPTFAEQMAPGEPTVTRNPAPADWVADWEQHERKFQILAQWSDSLPHDGVHIEPVLGDAVAIDEWRAMEIRALHPGGPSEPGSPSTP